MKQQAGSPKVKRRNRRTPACQMKLYLNKMWVYASPQWKKKQNKFYLADLNCRSREVFFVVVFFVVVVVVVFVLFWGFFSCWLLLLLQLFKVFSKSNVLKQIKEDNSPWSFLVYSVNEFSDTTWMIKWVYKVNSFLWIYSMGNSSMSWTGKILLEKTESFRQLSFLID